MQGVWYTGRTAINADGTRSFDWEGTQMWVALTGASYVKAVINSSGTVGRFSAEVGASDSHTMRHPPVQVTHCPHSIMH
jgi:hypothetical protein